MSAKSLIANTTNANDNGIMGTGPFVLRTPLLTTYSQQLWLIARMETDNHDNEKFDKTFQVNVRIEGISKDHIPVPVSNVRNRYDISCFIFYTLTLRKYENLMKTYLQNKTFIM